MGCPVRGTIAKGHFVQRMQHPVIFGRGQTTIAPTCGGAVYIITVYLFTWYVFYCGASKAQNLCIERGQIKQLFKPKMRQYC